MDSYRLPMLQQQNEAPDYQKIYKFFYNSLPTNFSLNSHTLVGECVSNQLSSSSDVLTSKRKRNRLIINNHQLLLMQVAQGRNQKVSRNKYIRILYEDVTHVRLSVYYCGLILVYEEYDGGDQRKEHVINIQIADIGGTRRDSIRQNLVKYISDKARVDSERLSDYCERTLLDFQKVGKKGEKKDQYELSANGDTMVTASEIRKTRIINLAKKKQEAVHKIGGLNHKSNQKKQANEDLNKIYKLHSEIIHKNQQEHYRAYIASRCTKTNSHRPSQLSLLKIYSKKKLGQLDSNLAQIYNESQCKKHYQIMTPYIPVLNRVFVFKQSLFMEYKYFEGKSLRQLLAQDKLEVDKKYLRDLFAEIVVAIGHVHECGFLYRVGLDNVMVNFDGHVMLKNIGLVQRVNIKKEELIELKKLEKTVQKLSPQQVQFPQGSLQFGNDWWCLGLLFYQIVVKSTLFQDMQPQKIKQQLKNRIRQLNFQYLEKKTSKDRQLQNLIKALLNKNPLFRLGHKNDYHAILDVTYFKGIDKKKLMKRQGEPLMKIKQTKFNQETDIKFFQNDQNPNQMKQIDKKLQKALEECIFDINAQFQ